MIYELMNLSQHFKIGEETHAIHRRDAVKFMTAVPDDSVSLLWTDPPFGTGDKQKLLSSGMSYDDVSTLEVVHMMESLVPGIKRVMKEDGLVAILLDWRSIHDVVVALKRQGLHHISDIVWHFETGGLSKKWWSNKHNIIALFCTSDKLPAFDFDTVPTVERKAPKAGYVEPKKVNSVWNVNMSTTDPQRVGYPTQKPLDLAKTLIEVHTQPGDLVIDPFAGSGTLAEAAVMTGRSSMSGDASGVACQVIEKRLEKYLDG